MIICSLTSGGIMFKNYLKIAIRNISRHKTFSLINISGLAIGLACTILILLWVQDELSYDSFHKNADHIYFLARGDSEKIGPFTSKLLAPALKAELPEVINAANYTAIPDLKFLVKSRKHTFEESISLTDQPFFEVFTFPFLSGSPSNALNDPQSVVITDNIAKKYFGQGNALGQSLTFSIFGHDFEMKITGVIENIPHHSHIQSEIFIPIKFVRILGIDWNNWNDQSLYTYILTQHTANIQDLAKKITACEQRNHSSPNLENLRYQILPIKKIHLHGSKIGYLAATGDVKYVYIFASIAFIIILIASINYTNLSTAGSLKRSKEIGIKKVVGANRSKLIQQFLGETLILTLIALIIALCLVQTFLPYFNQLSGKSISVPYGNIQFILGLCFIVCLTSILSGIYPAFFLSGFQPVKTIKGNLKFGSGKFNLRKGLLVFQFSLSIFMIVCTILLLRQLSFFRSSDLGYDKEHLVTIQLKGEVFNKYESLKNELLSNSDVLHVARSEPFNTMTRTNSINWDGKPQQDKSYILVYRVDYDFASTYRIEMLKGRFLSKDFSTDKDAYVINQKAADMMNLENPLNKEISLWGKRGEIIGLVKNFHFKSFHNAIEPLIIKIPKPDRKDIDLRLLTIRFKPGTLPASLKHVEDTWRTLFPDIPCEFHFVDDTLENQYHAEKRMAAIFNYFSVFAIFIACLGLYGLTLFSIEQKTKEIGIRKLLGSSVSEIVALLTKDFTKWVILANFFAWPIAYYAMNKWLQNFAYRIDLTIWSFLSYLFHFERS